MNGFFEKSVIPFFCLSTLIFTGCFFTPQQVGDIQRDIYETKVRVGQIKTLQEDTYNLFQLRMKEMDQSRRRYFEALTTNQENLEKEVERLRGENRTLELKLDDLEFQLRKAGVIGEEFISRENPDQKSPPEITVSEKGETIDGDALFQSGYLSFTKGDYELAADYLNRYLEHFPHSGRAEEAHFLLADSFYYSKEYQKAFDLFSNLESQYPAGDKIGEARVKAALCLQKLGKTQLAVDLLRKTLKEHPDSVDKNRVLSLIQEME